MIELIRNTIVSVPYQSRSLPVAGRAPAAAGKGQATTLHTHDTAPIDPARIAELRLAIAEGRYAIDSRRIAERMIGAEQPLVTSA